MSNINGRVLKEIFLYAYHSLAKNKEAVNALNVFPVPDGDTGTNMTLTMHSAMNQLEKSEEEAVDKVSKIVSNGSLMGARGNSGVILSQILRGFANGLEGCQEIDRLFLAQAFEAAAATAYKAVMKPTEGTILTVIRKMAEYASDHKMEDIDLDEFMIGIISEGNRALEDTPNLLPILKEAGVVDAGGKGLMILVESAFRYFSDDKDYVNDVDFHFETQNFDAQVRLQQEETGNITFGYCTEFLIHTKDSETKTEDFRDRISSLGDCVLVVSGEGLIKVHIHTNNPGQVLEHAVQLGALEDIKIDNMRLQNEKIRNSKKTHLMKEQKELKKFSFIAVSSGEGMNKVFQDLNVDVLIEGGQTMNPSTEDFLKAIDEVTGENIFLLPNNSNIILAAEQAKSISKRKVHVIPSKSIPEGMVALLNIQEDETAEKNLEIITETLPSVRTGSVTFAVRDSVIDGVKIEKGNYIGIEKGKIYSNGKILEDVTTSLIEAMYTDSCSLITIFYGNNVPKEEVFKVKDEIKKQYSDCDVELVWGGQPLYYYIISME